MATSEAARADLYNGLSEIIGPRRTETLMSAMRLHDLDELATKSDVALLEAKVADLRAEMKSDIAALQKTVATWMLAQSVAVIGAIAGVAFLT